MVAEQGEKVVGFMIYELHKNKLHILNFAVHPSCRRLGVGAQMTAKLDQQTVEPPADADHAGGARDEPGGAAVLPSQGFRAVRVLRAFYEDSGEDAFLMQYRLADDVERRRRGRGEPHRPV